MSATTLDGFPEFPRFRKVELRDKETIEGLFADFPTEVSERTFGSLYVWRGYEGRSMLSRLEDHLLVSWHRERSGGLVLAPVGPDPASVIAYMARSPGTTDSPVRTVWAIIEPLVGELRLIGMSPAPLRDEWDYVYKVEDLVKLADPKYRTQRKEIKKATSLPRMEYAPITRDRRQACLELEEAWCDIKHCAKDRLSNAEDAALREALENMDELGFFGGVVLIDGKVQALTLAERLNSNTAVVHFEKANPGIRGLYQVINQRFCEHALPGYEFVNREQDIGEPGLRRAKEGYHPHHFVEKHLLSLW